MLQVTRPTPRTSDALENAAITPRKTDMTTSEAFVASGSASVSDRTITDVATSTRPDANLKRQTKCNDADCLLAKPTESNASISVVPESLAS